jgi:hypothetical protein
MRVVGIASGVLRHPRSWMFSTTRSRPGIAENIPFPSRLGRSTEYAALVRHIAENVMINGETIRLDGVLRLGLR